jgi:predicted  nucleic acid-binding Zn-ribbon protein
LKNILSTTGQFAKGLGQSSQYVKNFSADLTKAAADYAAYQGKTSAADVNEYARKFAKATLGEVGELKDIGIVIDTTSKQFQDAVKEMQELTGATEAQAKQMAIQKELLEQVEIAAGSASKNMYDGWAQLNKLFDQFKEILGGVGEIFSGVFGPILSTLNGILEIPLVKSTASWVVAIAGVAYGYAALLKTLSLIRSTMIGTTEAQKLSVELQVKALQNNAKVLAIKKEELKIQERITDLEIKLAKTKADLKAKGLKTYDRTTALGKEYASLSSQKSNAGKALKDYQKEAEKALGAIGAEFKDLSESTVEALGGLVGLDPAFINLVRSVNGITVATGAATAAEISLANARKGTALASLAESLTKINQRIPNLVGGMAKFIKTGKIAPGIFTGLGAGLKACLIPLAAIIGKLAILAAVFVIVHDLIKRIG